MAKESTQKKLSRVRPPRVQITYDVEVGDAMSAQGEALRLYAGYVSGGVIGSGHRGWLLAISAGVAPPLAARSSHGRPRDARGVLARRRCR